MLQSLSRVALLLMMTSLACGPARRERLIVAEVHGPCAGLAGIGFQSEYERPFLACTRDGTQLLRCVTGRWAPLCGCPAGCQYRVWEEGFNSGSDLRCLNANGRQLDHSAAVSGQCVPSSECDPAVGTGTCHAGAPNERTPWSCEFINGMDGPEGCQVSWACQGVRREIQCQNGSRSECRCLRDGVEESRFSAAACPGLRPLELEATANQACDWRLPSPRWP